MGSPKPQTTTTKVELSPEQREMLNLAMPNVREFAAQVPKRYPGTAIAPFSPEQVAGQEAVLRGAGAQQSIADAGAGAANFFLGGDIWNPETNPYLDRAVDAAVRPIQENFEQNLLPGIRGGAISAGQLGGSRQGVAEGLAATGTQRAIGETASRLVQDQYANNLNAQLKALGLAPQTSQIQLSPGLATSGVGDIRRSMEQALLGEQVQNFNWDQYAPFLQAKEIVGLLGATPGGQTTATATGGGPSPFGQVVGGVATLAGLLGGVPGLGAGAGGLGGILPFL